jgi:monoamine oxidase
MQRLHDSPPASDRASDALDPKGEWNSYIRAIAGFISGASVDRLSIADYMAYDEASSDDNWRVASGLGAVVASSFPSGVGLRLATSADSITLGSQGVSIATSAGVLRSRAAILTVSTAVLTAETLKLPAELASWREAASRLPLGRNEKLYLEVLAKAPFEDETQVLGNPRDACTASYYIRPLGASVIECFFGGEGAELFERSGPAAASDFAIGQLCALFGTDTRKVLRPLLATSWRQMKAIGGAYSYALPKHTAARTALAQPFDDRVFFAGEATSAGDFSTVHGAHDSGVRAAGEAIAALA